MNLSQETIARIKVVLEQVQMVQHMTPMKLGELKAAASIALIDIDLDIKFPGTVQ